MSNGKPRRGVPAYFVIKGKGVVGKKVFLNADPKGSH